jgi:hypothetical protein
MNLFLAKAFIDEDADKTIRGIERENSNPAYK